MAAKPNGYATLPSADNSHHGAPSSAAGRSARALMRVRSSSWSSPRDAGEDGSRVNSPSRRSVAIIGYLPDLQPLMRRSARSFGDLASLEAAGTGDALFPGAVATPADGVDEAMFMSPATTPLLSAFKSKASLSKWFREGSVRGSVFNLCSATLGAGALSLPYAFRLSGWALGTVMLIVGALATVYSIDLLIRARNATGCKSYEELTVHIFGHFMGIIVELNIFIFCFGTAVAYIIAIGDIIEPILELTPLPGAIFGSNSTEAGVASLPAAASPALAPSSSSSSSGGGDDNPSSLSADQQHLLRILSMVTFFCCVMFPLSLLEKINSLRFTSFFGVLSIVYLVIATAFESVSTAATEGWGSSWGQAALVSSDWFDIVKAAPIMMFAFTCQVNVFSIYDELERPSPRRMGKVTNNAILTCFLVYISMGLLGVLEFRDATRGNILENYRSRLASDTVVMFAYAAISVTIVMAFPLLVFPCRYTVEVMFFSGKEPSRCRHLVLTVLICGAALVIAIFVEQIQVVFQLMGGTTSAFVCFILPAAFAIKLSRRGVMQLGSWHSCGTWSLVIGGIIVGMLSTGVTIYGIATGTG